MRIQKIPQKKNKKGKRLLFLMLITEAECQRANVMRRVECLGRSSNVMSAYVGLDVHKDWTFATVLNQDGQVVAGESYICTLLIGA